MFLTPAASVSTIPAVSLTLDFNSKVIPIGTVATTIMPVNLEQKVEGEEEERKKLMVGGAVTN